MQNNFIHITTYVNNIKINAKIEKKPVLVGVFFQIENCTSNSFSTTVIEDLPPRMYRAPVMKVINFYFSNYLRIYSHLGNHFSFFKTIRENKILLIKI